MAVIDLRQTLDRLISERRGVSDDTAISPKYGSLQQLRQQLDEALRVRSGEMPLTERTCSNHVATTCEEHIYPSYTEHQKSIGLHGDEMSLGDLNIALGDMTYCTCNGRHAAGCTCRENAAHDYCICNSRTVYSCDCQGRTGGKYGPPSCSCEGRTGAMCNCRARTASFDCTCEGRCSCDVVKEFSYERPNDDCICNTRAIPSCSCDTKQVYGCRYHSCDCFSRSVVQQVISTCRCNTKRGICRLYATTSTTYEDNKCSGNINESYSNFQICECVTRCACNVKQVFKGDI